MHLNTIPDLPSAVNLGLPPALDTVVLKALEKDPANRYASVEEMAEALNRVLGHASKSAQAAPVRAQAQPDTSTTTIPLKDESTQPVPQQQPTQKKPAWPVALIAGLLVCGVLLAYFLNNRAARSTVPMVLAGEEGTPPDVAPDAAAIEAARRTLGRGFVAYVTCNQSSEYHATQSREIVEFSEAYGLETRVYDSNNDSYTQVTLLERARAEGAGGIILCNLDPALLDTALNAVEEAQIPLVQFHDYGTYYGGVAFRGDEFLLGQGAGLYAGQLVTEQHDGRARVIIMDYPDLPSIVERADGIEAGILENAPEADIIGRYRGGTVDDGKASVAALIEEGISFDVIASINDAGGYGALEALEEAGIGPDEVAIVGIDAEERALQYIREGRYFQGSVPVDRRTFSQISVDSMVMLLAGQPIPQVISVAPGEVITQANIDAER